MKFNRCGRSGVLLPAISLGLWQNFGHDTPHETKRAMCARAFDLGITHFDLANNYGSPPGSAEFCAAISARTATNSSFRAKPVTACGTAPMANGAAANT